MTLTGAATTRIAQWQPPGVIQALSLVLAVALGATHPVWAAPAFGITGVTNAASYRVGSVSPGEIVTVFGAGLGGPRSSSFTLDAAGRVPTQLAGTRVLFGSQPAPVLFARQDQVVAIVPFSAAGKASVQLAIEYQGASASVQVPVLPTLPGVFTADSSGKGQGAVLNQDGSVNSPANPALRGSIVSLFATGAGQTDPPGAEAEIAKPPYPRPLLPVIVGIGKQLGDVRYAGAAPGMVAGLLQVNVQIPVDALPGAAVSLRIAVGDQMSQDGVTLAVAQGTVDTPDGIIDGLSGRWTFDEGGGTVAGDSSGFGNFGTLVGSPAWVAGKLGSALRFNGTNASVAVANAPRLSFGSGPFTVSAWINLAATPGSGNGFEFQIAGLHKWAALVPNDLGWTLFATTPGLRFHFNDVSYVEAPFTWSLNTWYHVAATRDQSGGFRLFVNGNQVGSTVTKSTSTDCTTQPLTMGASANNFTRFNGVIDDIRLYNRALSPAEIKALYSSPR